MLEKIERNAEHLQRVAEDLLADPGAGRGLKVAFTQLDLARLLAQPQLEEFLAGLTELGLDLGRR